MAKVEVKKLSKKVVESFIDEITDIMSSGQGSPAIDDWHEGALKELYKTIPIEYRPAVYKAYLKSISGDSGMEPLYGEKEFMKQLFNNKIKESTTMSKETKIELLESEIEKLSGKKIKLVEESKPECSCKKEKLTEAKKEEKEEKEEKTEESVEDTTSTKSDEAALKAATEDASEPILGNIIPASVIKEIDAYVTNTLAEIDKATTQLRAIKKQITSGATASNEDFSTLTDRIAFLVKQLSRVALYSNNTIKANKFDKALLDKIFDQKEL